MNVRLRLILGSLLVALFVLALFSSFAYRLFQNAVMDEKAALLVEAGQLYAQQLKANPQDPGTQPHTQISAYLYNRDNGKTNWLNSVENNRSPLEIKPLVESGQHQGQITIGSSELLWIKKPLNNDQTLILVIPVDQASATLTNELIKKLLIIALISVWISIWIALIIAKRIVSHIEKQNDHLMHQALHDHLTELPNRNHLYHWLEERIGHKWQQPFYLAVLDLNNFKEINDTLGHNVGDEILIMICHRLQTMNHHAQFIARLGGDSFAVIYHHGNGKNPDSIVAYIQSIFEHPYNLYGLDIMMSGSIGITSYPDSSITPEQLVKHAEVAMYQAKHNHTTYAIYDEEKDPYNLRRLALTHDLSKAIEEDHLVLFFQPKVDSASFQATSVEALVRWNHPEHGFIPPVEFIPLAEKSLLIDHLSLWVLNKAAKQVKEWQQNGLNITVAVNISTQNLKDIGFAAQIENILSLHEVSPSMIKLEITESAMMADPEQSLQNLHALHDMGLHLSIDDFGTGYSSLSYLKKLPVEELKIDGSFVKDMTTDENDRTIVYSTIELAHNMGCTVVAEGVEDEATLKLLLEKHCETIQGFYFSAPKPANEVTEWIMEHNKKHSAS